MNAEREMTLAEWVGTLPSHHLAAREYATLLRQRDEAVKALRDLARDCMASDFNEHWDSFKQAELVLSTLSPEGSS